MIPLIIFYIFIFSILFGVFFCVIESDDSLSDGAKIASCLILAILWPIVIPAMIAYYITSKFFDKEQ